MQLKAARPDVCKRLKDASFLGGCVGAGYAARTPEHWTPLDPIVWQFLVIFWHLRLISGINQLIHGLNRLVNVILGCLILCFIYSW